MKFTINKNMLEKTLDRASLAIDSATFFPPLLNFLFELRQENLSITASNGDLSIKGVLETKELSEVKELGKMLINANLLRNVVKKLDGDIQFEVSNNILELKNKEDSFSLNLSNYNEYPNIEFMQTGTKISVDAEEFKKAIKNTSFAAGANDSEIIFNCINLDIKKGFITFNATDRFRLATEKIKITEEEAEINVSLFAKNLRDFIPQDIQGIVEIYVDESKMNMKFENIIIQSKIVELPYKDISNIFPKPEELSFALEIDKKELSDLISKATVVSSDRQNRIRISFNSKEMVVNSAREEIGSSKVRTKEMKWKGEELSIVVNHKFLKDAISVFSDKILMFINSRANRILIISNSNKNNKQLITPQQS